MLQYRLELPAEIVWVHVAIATLLWVGIVLAGMQVGPPRRAAAAEAGLSAGAAGSAPASALRP